MTFLSIHLLILFGATLLGGCAKQTEFTGIAPEKLKAYANELYNRELYAQAAVAYEQYLERTPLDDRAMANIDYIVGNIYMDKLHDYENAMARYLRVRTIYPQTNLEKEINRRIVECLERLDRSLDAQRVLEQATALDSERPSEVQDDLLLAQIGSRIITRQNLEDEIEKLPPYLRSQYDDKAKRLDFLKQYIATELMYDTAKRKGYDDDKDIIEATFQAKKGFMVQKLIEEEIRNSVKIDESDIKIYYQAHKDKYKEKGEGTEEERPLDYLEARERAAQDLLREKQQEAYDRLMARMLSAEEVKIYEDRLGE